MFSSRAEARRRRLKARLGFLAALLVVAVGAVFLISGLTDGAPDAGFAPLSEGDRGSDARQGDDSRPSEEAAEAGSGAERKKAPPEEPPPDPEAQAPEAAAAAGGRPPPPAPPAAPPREPGRKAPAGAPGGPAAPLFPGVTGDNVGVVYRSRMDPSW